MSHRQRHPDEEWTKRSLTMALESSGLEPQDHGRTIETVFQPKLG